MSPTHCTPSDDVRKYIVDNASRFDTTQFSMVPSVGSALVVSLGERVQETAMCDCGKRWKHCGSSAVSYVLVVCRKMMSPFVWCREKHENQGRLAGLLAAVRRPKKIPNFVATDLPVLPEDLELLYVNANSAYWA